MAQLLVQAVHRCESQKSDDEKSGVDQRVEDTVQGQSLIVALDAGSELAVEVNAHVLQHLKRPKPGAEKERAESDTDMPRGEFFF